MNDLSFVINEVLNLMSQFDLNTRYQELINLMNQLVSSPSPEIESQLRSSTYSVVNAHKKFSDEGWSFARKNIFKKLACEELVGDGGVRFLNRTFAKNTATSPQTIAQELQTRKDEINQLITRLGQIKAGLGGLGEYRELEIAEGNVYMEIVFDKEVAIKSVDQLQKQADDWVNVFKSYQRLFPHPTGEIQVVYINKVNPAIWGLSIPVILAQVFEKTVSPILRVRQEWLKGQILAEKLSHLRNQNAYLKRGWKKEEAKIEDAKIVDITDKIVKEHKKSLPSGTTAAEVTAFVNHNTRFIFDFIKNGGSIDLTADKGGKFSAKLKLDGSYMKVHQLEEKARNLLEAPKLEAKVKTSKKVTD